jgi:type I restriction enzyme S subunit
MTCNQACCALIVDDKIADFRYVYYLLLQHRDVIKSLATGAAQQNLSAAQIKQFRFAFPDRQAQGQVADVLSGLDDKIDLNRRINQTLESMAQALFKSWFVDFDPVKAKIAAKAEGRDPLRAAMSAISGKGDAELDTLPPEAFNQLAATAALFPDEMEASELGEIPRGWSLAELSTFCDLNASNWSTKTLPTTVKYVDLANTKNGEIIEVQAMGGADIPSRARRILQPGDTIVGTVRPGNRSYALVAEAGLTGSTGFAVLHPKAKFLREYVYLAATFDENIERLAHLADGGAYPAVRPELVVTSLLPNPDESLLREFHRVSSHMFDQVLGNRKTNQELAQLRDTLLPKLLSGELSVDALNDEVAHAL